MGIMDRLAAAFAIVPAPLLETVTAGPTFVVDETSVAAEVFGLVGYSDPTNVAPRVTRRVAIQCGAVKHARDLICVPLAGTPLAVRDARNFPIQSTLVAQPERDRPRSVTMADTIEDMLFEKVAWWRKTELDWQGYPLHVEYLAATRVTVAAKDDARPCPEYVDGCSGRVSVDSDHEHDVNLIRFDSPNDALLVAGARAIRTALMLEHAVSLYSDGAPPIESFTSSDGYDPPQEKVTEFLNGWQSARRTRGTAWIPSWAKRDTGGFNPQQLQLKDARDAAVLELARHAGVDPEELGVPVTSRTYANVFDRRKQFTDFTQGAYRTAIAERLSMGDVTRRGQVVYFDLDAFLNAADAETRFRTYKLGVEVGAIDPEEIRPMEGKPPLGAITAQPQAAPNGDSNVTQLPVAASQPSPHLAMSTQAPAMPLTLETPAQAFRVDAAKRTITGLIIPYGGAVARSLGESWRFSQGVVTWSDPSRVKLRVEHDATQVIGLAVELDDREDGLYGTFRVARGPEGDRALSLAEDGVLDGLSAGIREGGSYRRAKDGTNDAVSAPLMEVSLTSAPAFDDARVTAVAASAANQEGNLMKCSKCGHVHAAGVVECAAPGGAVATATAPPPGADQGASFSQADAAQLAALAVAEAFRALGHPVPTRPDQAQGPDRISATGTAFTVREELPYRFASRSGGGKFCLTDDIRASAQGNADATIRLERFMDEVQDIINPPRFAVTTGNAGAFNPTQNRPELYVPQLAYSTPLQDLISTGSIDSITGFTVPKFSSASGLVGAHTQGVEPTPGAFVATAQTVTPTALSGKMEIVREVWDQGGSPQLDTIVWGEMLNAWADAREARIATLLNGLTLTETNLASAVGSALVDAFTGILADLQFVRGGNRYTSLGLDGLTFKALIQAKDTTGRNILPVLGPVNAQGQVTGAFDRVQIGGLTGRAAWPLGATNASHSYLLVPTSVWQWASTPKRFTFDYRVSMVDIAIWGYEANASLRDSDVKRIDYTTADV